jgi:hypothetical protein
MALIGSRVDPFGAGSEPGGAWGAPLVAVVGRFRGALARVRLEMGSSEMTRGFGSGTGAMSMVSVRYTFVSHEAVGEMVVGRVRVAFSM